MTEDGEALYSHWCSNKYFAIGDLIERRPERQKECKEKYGELRFYTSELIDGGNKIIEKYADLSCTIYEMCGNKGETKIDKYWQTLCEDCYGM